MFNEHYPNTQFYEHYTKWEDYLSGMYATDTNEPEYYINKSKIVLSNPELFKSIAIEVVNTWVVATKVNFTNNGINKRAWLGQASCCFKYKSPEFFTRLAWKELTEYQRISANLVAKEIIHNWIEKHIGNEQETIKF